MGKMTEKPRYNVISIRISAKEREYLDKVTLHSKMNISDVMRDAMQRFIGIHDQPESKKRQ